MNELKRARRYVGFTQKTLAKESGIALMRIAFWETGRTQLSRGELHAIRLAIRRRAQQIAKEFAEAA